MRRRIQSDNSSNPIKLNGLRQACFSTDQQSSWVYGAIPQPFNPRAFLLIEFVDGNAPVHSRKVSMEDLHHAITQTPVTQSLHNLWGKLAELRPLLTLRTRIWVFGWMFFLSTSPSFHISLLRFVSWFESIARNLWLGEQINFYVLTLNWCASDSKIW